MTDVWVPYINLTDVFSAKVEDMRLLLPVGDQLTSLDAEINVTAKNMFSL